MGDAEVPHVGLTLAAIDGFRARLAEETRGRPGGYVPSDGAPRRAAHEHALLPNAEERACNVCRVVMQGTGRWCKDCGYDECATCFAESERLKTLPPVLLTADVDKLAKQYVTQTRRCAYTSLLDEHDATLVGEANVFVSHAWEMPFDALVAALRDADAALRAQAPGTTPYFWLDVLVNDQFAAPTRSFSWWSTVFRESVRRIGRTVVVLDWEQPLPLVRAWCVWEMFCSVSDGAALELALPSASRAAAKRAFVENFNSVEARLCRIYLQDADAFHGGSGKRSCRSLPGGCPSVALGQSCPNDRELILRAVSEAPGGVEAVTSAVTGALRGWLVRAAREELGEAASGGGGGSDSAAASELHFFLARFLEDCGRPGEAEALMREGLAARRRTCGDDDSRTLLSARDLGALLVARGDTAGTELLARELPRAAPFGPSAPGLLLKAPVRNV